jgi:hypothetical protein
MIKRVLFSAALLVPGTAYAANPSASFTDQVVPAGSDPIACDVGTPYIGSIPAPARAAGFTHCVANYDFTQTASFTSGGNTYQWSNLASWNQCSGASSPLLFNKDYGSPNNCADITVATDDACGGCQTLRMQYQPTDTNGQTWLSSASEAGYPNSAGVHIKHGFYAEGVLRAGTNYTTSCNNACIFESFSADQTLGSCNSCGNVAPIFNEMYDGGGAYAIMGGPNFPSGANWTPAATLDVYETYGWLDTVVNSNSGNNSEGCGVLNEHSPSQACGAVHQDLATAINQPTFEFYPSWVGFQQAPNPVQTEVMNIQRVTIWACNGYANSTSGLPCYTSSLVTY